MSLNGEDAVQEMLENPRSESGAKLRRLIQLIARDGFWEEYNDAKDEEKETKFEADKVKP